MYQDGRSVMNAAFWIIVLLVIGFVWFAVTVSLMDACNKPEDHIEEREEKDEYSR